jgi:hypothetical protein
MPRVTNLGGMLVVLALFVTVLAYLPGLSGPFLFDDKPNLLFNPFMYLEALEARALKDAALSNESGFFRRVIPSLSFALNYYFAGEFDPFPFKLTNLVIHLLNGILVFALAKRLTARFLPDVRTDSPRVVLIAVAVASWWLLHPLQLTSVLYVVQRMNSLSALFVLAGLLLFTVGRARLEHGAAGGLTLMLTGVIGGGTLGVLCKENAALIPLYAIIIEVCCFYRLELEASARMRLRFFYWAILGVPLLLVLAYMAIRPEFILDSYQGRTFTMAERLLTQPRVLFFYLGLIAFPSRHALGLYHDDFQLSEGLFAPFTTFLALAGWIALVALAFGYRRKMPVLFFAVAWYLAGHVMESTILPLEMVFEHRNYLPSLGPIFVLAFAVSTGVRRLTDNVHLVYTTLGMAILTLGFVTHSRAYSWSETQLLLESMTRHHPEAARTHGFYAEVLLNARADAQKAFYHLQQYSRLSPESINGLAEMLRLVKGTDPSATKRSASGTGNVSLFETSLTNDEASLARLEQLLVDEIERRIRSYPISPSTVKTIEDLQRCLYEGARICVDLAPELATWSELALANPRIIRGHRAILLLASAKIQTWLGNIEKGKAYAKLAVETAPGEVHFLIQLARLNLELGEYARGLAVLERIESQGPRFGFRMSEVAALKAQLRSEMSNQSAGARAAGETGTAYKDMAK